MKSPRAIAQARLDARRICRERVGHGDDVERERATRAFLGDEETAPAHRYDLADDVDDAMPSTVAVKGLRAAEEA